MRMNRIRIRLHYGQRGLSLIELMVSIAVGLFVVAALTILFSQQSSVQVELEKSSRQIENGRYAVQLVARDLELAGYFGEYTDGVAASSVPTSLPDPCERASRSGLETSIAFPVQGVDFAPGDTGTTGLPSCVSSANYKLGTDILVVRRAGTAEASTLTSGAVYIQTGLKANAMAYAIAPANSSSGVIDTSLKRKSGDAGWIRPYHVYVYYVGKCSKCSGAGADSIPTLRRVDVTSAGAVDDQPVVEGIEHFQIDYGLDSDADGSPDRYVAIPQSITEWQQVSVIRVHVIGRNNEPTPGYSDTKSYTLGLSGVSASTTIVSASNDSFKRHVFTQTVRIVNPSMRKER